MFESCRAHREGRRGAQIRMVTCVRCVGDAAKTRTVLSPVLSSEIAYAVNTERLVTVGPTLTGTV